MAKNMFCKEIFQNSQTREVLLMKEKSCLKNHNTTVFREHIFES